MSPSYFRADQVGSLLRPPAVLAALGREDDASGSVDTAIIEALEAQRAAGLSVFSDGEFRRTGFLGGFIDAVDGIDSGAPVFMPWKGGAGDEPTTATNSRRVVRRLSLRHSIADEEARFLKEHSPGPFKITLPSAGTFALTGWDSDESKPAYATRSDLIVDTGTILADEAGVLAERGTPYIQVDAPGYTMCGDPTHVRDWARRGVDLDDVFDAMLAADNSVLSAAKDKGAVTGCHLCRGNNMGRWMSEGGYEPIAERLFNVLRCDRFLLEYDTENAGDFRPLRHVPRDIIVVLGLISTKTGALEVRDDVLRRLDEASKYVSIGRLAISPQCGFASTAAGNPLSIDEQWRKLELVGAIAQEVWGSESGD